MCKILKTATCYFQLILLQLVQVCELVKSLEEIFSNRYCFFGQRLNNLCESVVPEGGGKFTKLKTKKFQSGMQLHKSSLAINYIDPKV